MKAILGSSGQAHGPDELSYRKYCAKSLAGLISQGLPVPVRRCKQGDCAMNRTSVGITLAFLAFTGLAGCTPATYGPGAMAQTSPVSEATLAAITAAPDAGDVVVI